MKLLERTGLGAYYKNQEENSRQRMAASAAESIDSIREIAARHVCKQAFVDTYLEAMVSEAAADQMDRLHPGASRDDRITLPRFIGARGTNTRASSSSTWVEDILPHRRMTGSEADIEEERRVFYVALTRAEERLCITTQRKHPSRFLDEMKPADGGGRLTRLRNRLMRFHGRLVHFRGRLMHLRGQLTHLRGRLTRVRPGSITRSVLDRCRQILP